MTSRTASGRKNDAIRGGFLEVPERGMNRYGRCRQGAHRRVAALGGRKGMLLVVEILLVAPLQHLGKKKLSNHSIFFEQLLSLVINFLCQRQEKNTFSRNTSPLTSMAGPTCQPQRTMRINRHASLYRPEGRAPTVRGAGQKGVGAHPVGEKRASGAFRTPARHPGVGRGPG